MAKFKLSDKEDTVIGSGNDDKIVGGIGTLQTEDFIDGGAGLDTLVADAEQNGAQAPTIQNVEDIFIDSGGLPFDISNITGADRIVADEASATFTNIAEEDLTIRFGARDVSSGTVTFDFLNGTLSASDTLLELESIDSNVTFKAETDAQAAEIELINLALTGKDEQVDLSAFNELQELMLLGGANSKVVVDSPDLMTINASAMTGNLTINSVNDNNQTLFGGSGDDNLKTGLGNDTIETGDGDDIVNAGGGDNDIDTGDGKDEVFSESGNDTIRLGDADDFVNAGSGDDLIFGDDGNDEIIAGDGADTIYGGNNEDVIEGRGGNDVIYDGRNEDVVDGGGDDDTFFAGQGDDEFTGAGGSDTFNFIQEGKFGTDTVTDFTLSTDEVEFLVNGTRYDLSTRDEFCAFFNAEKDSGDLNVDQGTSTLTVETDLGTAILNLSDADFLMNC